MSAEDLDILDPPCAQVQFRGERLDIQPLTMGQLPRFVRLARPIINALLDASVDESADTALVDVLLDLVAQHGESAIAAASVVTGRPESWIEGGNPAEFIELVIAVVGVNRDFFTQRLAPLLAKSVQLASGSGQTLSSSSSSTGTH